MIKKAAFAVSVFLATIIIYVFTELIHWEGRLSLSIRNYLMVALVVTASAVIHLYRRRHTAGSYGRELLMGYGGGRQRIAYFDYLRVFAMILVITLHTLQGSLAGLEGDAAVCLWNILIGLCFVCNPLFVMVSGALLLNGREEPLHIFYRKRVMRVLVPMIGYYLFYSFWADGLSVFYPSGWMKLIQEFTANTNVFTPHFWLAFVILMFYISAPFLRVMVKNMDDAMLSGMVLVIFLVHGIFLYLPLWGINFAGTTWLLGWESVGLVGYFCTTKAAERYRRVFWAGGGIALLSMIYVTVRMEEYSSLFYNTSPAAMILACVCFLFFRFHGSGLFAKAPALLMVLSKYSFSILLIHWLVLNYIVKQALGITFVPLAVFCTLAVSLAAAFFYDNLVIVCLEWLFAQIFDLPGRVRRNAPAGR